MIERTEYYRYYSHAGDLSQVTIALLAYRLKAFEKVHEQEIKNRIRLAGGKI